LGVVMGLGVGMGVGLGMGMAVGMGMDLAACSTLHSPQAHGTQHTAQLSARYTRMSFRCPLHFL